MYMSCTCHVYGGVVQYMIFEIRDASGYFVHMIINVHVHVLYKMYTCMRMYMYLWKRSHYVKCFKVAPQTELSQVNHMMYIHVHVYIHVCVDVHV